MKEKEKHPSPTLGDNLEGFQISVEEVKQYEPSFRRWLVQEIESGRMSLLEARERFNLPYHFSTLYRQWQLKYSDQIVVSLRNMTEQERTKFKAQEDRIRQLERQVDDAQLKVKALNVLVDIAEKEYKIPLRKKAGAKQ